VDGSSNEAITKRKSYGTIEMKGKELEISGTITLDKDFAETRAPLK
jgi:hypothetical protein